MIDCSKRWIAGATGTLISVAAWALPPGASAEALTWCAPYWSTALHRVIRPRPPGASLGLLDQRGHTLPDHVVDVLALTAARDPHAFGYLYVDEYGLSWLQLDRDAAGVGAFDVATGIVIVGRPALARIFLNPHTVRIRRCAFRER
jgi:hypothetical protein